MARLHILKAGKKSIKNQTLPSKKWKRAFWCSVLLNVGLVVKIVWF